MRTNICGKPYSAGLYNTASSNKQSSARAACDPSENAWSSELAVPKAPEQLVYQGAGVHAGREPRAILRFNAEPHE